jgi:hypothetical protein
MAVLLDPAHPLGRLVQRLAVAPVVVAVALVGCRLNGVAASDSDSDVFIYIDGDLTDLRTAIADELADPASWRSVHERAFGDEDAWRLGPGGPWLDLMYWPTSWAERQLQVPSRTV